MNFAVCSVREFIYSVMMDWDFKDHEDSLRTHESVTLDPKE